MVKMLQVCPICFSTTGASIVLEDNGQGVLVCPQNAAHKFRVDTNGFLEQIKW
ncbi:MAG: hypothetical protein QW735_02215 [archaeon]